MATLGGVVQYQFEQSIVKNKAPHSEAFIFAKDYLNGVGVRVKKRKSSVAGVFGKLELA